MTSFLFRHRPTSDPVPTDRVQVFVGPDRDHRQNCGELLLTVAERNYLRTIIAFARSGGYDAHYESFKSDPTGPVTHPTAEQRATEILELAETGVAESHAKTLRCRHCAEPLVRSGTGYLTAHLVGQPGSSFCDSPDSPDAFHHVDEPPAPKTAHPEPWPLTLDEVNRIVAHLLNEGSRDGLILGDLLNSRMGASARRRIGRS